MDTVLLDYEDQDMYSGWWTWKSPFSISRDGDLTWNKKVTGHVCLLESCCQRLVLLIYLVSFFETASHIAKAVLEFLIFLPLPPTWQDHSHEHHTQQGQHLISLPAQTILIL